MRPARREHRVLADLRCPRPGAAELLVGVGDRVEGLDDLRLELGFHRRKRQRILEVVLFVFFRGAGGSLGVAVLVFLRRPSAYGGENGGPAARLPGVGAGDAPAAAWPSATRGAWLGVGPGVGGVEIDDVAQQDFAGVELVAPDDDGLERQRAFAEAPDHDLAAGFDALGDGDFALAREQLHRAHLAQIHAHRIVGAVGGSALGVGDDWLRPRPARRRSAARRRPPRLARPLRLLDLVCSTTLMPISLSIAMMSSICSEDTSSVGSTSFSSS